MKKAEKIKRLKMKLNKVNKRIATIHAQITAIKAFSI